MPVENIMYFALGLLLAGLVALMIMPAFWRRAVRLTKKRIEAATPMTMAEFRADKDQLRAEFALSTRRLEMNVEQLRKRLAEQVGDINRKKIDAAQLKSERDQHLLALRELDEREGELRARVLEMEKETTDLTQRLRMRDRDYSRKVTELEAAREALHGKLPKGEDLDGETLSGAYDDDVPRLIASLAVERKRSTYLEEQARELLTRLESSDRRSADTNAAIRELRTALAAQDDASAEASAALITAEARLASAESQLNALLEETSDALDGEASRNQQLLAEKLSLEEQVETLKERVLGVESSIMADWDTERVEQSQLRERLNDIASNVSRLIYAVDNNGPADSEESLFDRVQRFADDGLAVEEIPVQPPPRPGKGGAVSDRMAALRDIASRT
jgi:DNA repair exonuclease SbcCD ATPase subunit